MPNGIRSGNRGIHFNGPLVPSRYNENCAVCITTVYNSVIVETIFIRS